jgi:hypothetical protein
LDKAVDQIFQGQRLLIRRSQSHGLGCPEKLHGTELTMNISEYNTASLIVPRFRKVLVNLALTFWFRADEMVSMAFW